MKINDNNTIDDNGNLVNLRKKKVIANKEENISQKQKIIYARVSSLAQKNDLERQILQLKNKFPNYKLIKDIGSGMNMNR